MKTYFHSGLTYALTLLLIPTSWAAPKNSKSAEKATVEEQSQAAKKAGLDEFTFKRACKHNKHMHMDRSGRPFFSCETLPAQAQAGTDTSTYTSGETFAPEQTFRLHTRKGARMVIYLDFDGHTTIGTSWNSSFTNGAAIVTPAFDTDGNPSSFTPGELAAIQDVWRRVAEDFAPWDVDVTTEDPGTEAIRRTSPGDASYGVRCVIGGSSMQWLAVSAGGVAYVGSFDRLVTATATANDWPAFVFPEQLSGNARYIAEAASHEVGHTLGLFHSGQTNGNQYYFGHGDWAPIMGAAYYRTVTQWTRGDYPLANNQQDQINLITAKIPRVPDEHGNAITLASVLDGQKIEAGGIISDQNDTEWLKVTLAEGVISLTAKAANPSANLKIGLSLVDESGYVLAQGDASGMGATLNIPVDAGDYYMVIDGKGDGDALSSYTDYASLGRFSLTGTLTESKRYVTGGVLGGPITFPVRQPQNGILSSTTGSIPVRQPQNGLIATTSGSTPTSGRAPHPVQFVGTNSRDLDGIIVNYLWDFGDGSSSNFADPKHVYENAGNYVARLTVTDNSGAQGYAEIPVEVREPIVGKIAKVASIEPKWSKLNNSAGNVQVSLTIKDERNRPIPGATVSIAFSGLTSGTVTGITDRKGQLTAKSRNIHLSASGMTTITVREVSRNGYTYDSISNTTSSATINR